MSLIVNMKKNISRREFVKKVVSGLAVAGVPFLGGYLTGKDESRNNVSIVSSGQRVRHPIKYPADVPRIVSPMETDSFRFYNGSDMKQYVSHRLNDKVEGCDHITYGMLTTDGKNGGIHIPDAVGLQEACESARIFEDYAFDKFDKRGVSPDAIQAVSFFRPLSLDIELSPDNHDRRTHPYSLAFDFGSWKIPAKDLYGMLEEDWKGGLAKYTDRNAVHLDRKFDRWRKA